MAQFDQASASHFNHHLRNWRDLPAELAAAAAAAALVAALLAATAEAEALEEAVVACRSSRACTTPVLPVVDMHTF